MFPYPRSRKKKTRNPLDYIQEEERWRQRKRWESCCHTCGVQTHETKGSSPLTNSNVFDGYCRSCYKVFDTLSLDCAKDDLRTLLSSGKMPLNVLLDQCEEKSSKVKSSNLTSEVSGAFNAEMTKFNRENIKIDSPHELSKTIKIIGKDFSKDEVVWKDTYGDVEKLCAHSKYTSAFMARWNDSEEQKTIVLDASQFSKQVMDAILKGIETWQLDKQCLKSQDFLCHLITCTTYLGMEASSMMVGEAIVNAMDSQSYLDVFDLAESLNLEYVINCWGDKIASAVEAFTINTIASFEAKHMKILLSSDSLNLPEFGVFELLLIWRETASSATDDLMKELFLFVKTPFIGRYRYPYIPLKSHANRCISPEVGQLIQRFRSDRQFCKSHLGTSWVFQIRKNKINKELIVAALMQQRQEAERGHQDIWVQPRSGFGMVRMLGVVNGRDGFEKISSLKKTCTQLTCTGTSESEAQHFTICKSSENLFSLASKACPSRPDMKIDLEWIDSSKLETMQIEGVKNRLEMMLKYEDEMRLHPLVQDEYGRIGEDEQQMVTFTTELQAFVSKECHTEASVGIDLMRSASSLFPDIAQISHYVRHNRCFRGSLEVGDQAPDVALCDMNGKETSLWTALDSKANLNNPTLIVAASYT